MKKDIEVGKKYQAIGGATRAHSRVWECLWADSTHCLMRNDNRDIVLFSQRRCQTELAEIKPIVRRTFYLNMYKDKGYLVFHSQERDAKNYLRKDSNPICCAFPVTIEVEEGYGLSEASAASSVEDTK